jgi:hypothetical protein
MSLENHGGVKLTGETEELGENLSQYLFVHKNLNSSVRDETSATKRCPATNVNREGTNYCVCVKFYAAYYRKVYFK